MKTLIIDDDASCRNVFKLFFEKFGKCDLCSNGSDGIAMFKEAFISEKPYDLVVIDIIMPDINGSEVLRMIRIEEDMCNLSDFFRTKVLLTTSLDDEENRNLAKNLTQEIEAYYIKSFANEGLQEKLQELNLPNY